MALRLAPVPTTPVPTTPVLTAPVLITGALTTCVGLVALTLPAVASARPAALPDPAPGTAVAAVRGGLPSGYRDWAGVRAAQQPLSEAAGAIAAEAARTRSAPDGYAGVTVSLERRTVTVRWKGRVPAAVAERAAALRAPGTRIEIRPAAYSLAELDHRARALAERGTLGEGDRTHRIHRAGPRTDGGGLDIRVHATGPGAVSPAALPSTSGGIPVIVTVEEPPRPSAREDDAGRNGGIVLLSSGSMCSSGFGVTWPGKGGDYVLSAAHCGPAGSVWHTYRGARVGTVHDRDMVNDTLFLSTDGAAAGNRVWTGSGAMRPGQSTRPVRGAAHTFPGEYLCVSGSRTGLVCDVRVSRTGQYVVYPGGQRVHVNVLDHVRGALAAGSGDSGGPVFSVLGDGSGVIARGLISGNNGPFRNCSDGWATLYRCSSSVLVTDLLDALRPYPGMRVKTTS
ncbi:S1 family peptidase [Streptomyces sp. NPDC000594]|uniref:S1 family peptidase n=1 Tax=Streptomyces sp. NPDC000594 TaxID=3154261 RepID=UPI00332D6A68